VVLFDRLAVSVAGRLSTRGVALGFALLALTQCVWASDFDVDQCSGDEDCNFLGAPVQRCDGGRCRLGCTNNRQCGAADPRYPICPEVGAACVELTSEGSACSLSSDYVDATMGPQTARDLLVLGAFAPHPESATWLTLLLGARELNENGGLPDGLGGLRPVLVVTCDDDPDRMSIAMPHLLSDLGARAVVANVEARALAAAAEQARSRGPTLFLNPLGNDYRSDDTDTRWLWSLGAPSLGVAPAYSALLQRGIRRSLDRGGGDGFWRLVFLVGGSREDQALAEAVTPMLIVDGKPSSQLIVEDHLRIITLDEDSAERRAEQLGDLVATYPPNVVALFASGQFPDLDRSPRAGVLAVLESLAATAGAQPYYVVGPRNSAESAVAQLALADASVPARLVGLSADPPEDPASRARLTAAYARAFPQADQSLILQARTYDALYYLAYALAATPRENGALIAEDVLTGLGRVTTPGAQSVNVGPGSDGIDRATALLVGGQPMDLNGSTGPARFDAAQGRAGAIRLYCFAPGAELQSIARYDATASGDGFVLEGDGTTPAACGREWTGPDAD
jgi:hypothetical protein